MLRRWARERGTWLALTGVLTVGWMAILRIFAPGYWFLNDMRNQYVPAFRDIGRRLRSGELPTIDPNLGPSGNFSLDVQYGIYDPLHWAIAVAASAVPSLPLAGFLMAAAFCCVLAVGSAAVCLRLGTHGWWAATAGVAVATTGFVAYWLAPTWFPGLLSLSWLPWLWWAMVGDVTKRRLVAIAAFSYVIIAGGWPSTWLAFGAVCLGVFAEAWISPVEGTSTAARIRDLVLRAGAAAAGVAVAFVNVLPLMRASDYTSRSDEVSWGRFLVPDLLDLFNTVSVQTTVSFDNFTGSIEYRPLFFFGWFLVPLLWSIRWRRDVLRHRGILTGIVASVIMMGLTQLPETLGPLRTQVRQLAGFQVLSVVTVVIIAGTLGLTLSGWRVMGIAATWTMLLGIADLRGENGDHTLLWSIPATLAVVALVAALGAWRGHAARSGALALAATLALSSLAWGLMPASLKSRPLPDVASSSPVMADASRQPAITLYPRVSQATADSWRAQGVSTGFAMLGRDNRTMPGYSSVSSEAFRRIFRLRSSHGFATKASPTRLFHRSPSVGLRWYQLLGLRSLVVHRSLTDAVPDRPNNPFQPVASTQDFVLYTRPAQANGSRVTLAPPDATVRPLRIHRGTQSYRVDAPTGGRVVFRDLYWPGYHATLNGREIAVRPLDDLLVSIDLPRGAQGTLEVSWEPLGTGLYATVGGGLVLLVVVVLAERWWRPRRLTASGERRLNDQDGTGKASRT